MLSQDAIKEKVGKQAAELVQNDSIVGIGTGSTAQYFIDALAEKVKKGLNIKAIPTSERSRIQAEHLHIPTIDLNDVSFIDLVIDGADEINHDLQLIKGGGGALLREKMVASAAKKYIIIADHTKLVDELGLKNLRVGNARVSEAHGNFIVNDGGATATEMLDLIDHIKQTAKTKRGIELETEVQIVGEPR